jgi:hypothetical protein
MIGFETVFDAADGKLRQPSLAPQVLDADLLREYWKQNRTAILARQFEKSDRRVVTSNYTMTFQEGVPEIIVKLDTLM